MITAEKTAAKPAARNLEGGGGSSFPCAAACFIQSPVLYPARRTSWREEWATAEAAVLPPLLLEIHVGPPRWPRIRRRRTNESRGKKEKNPESSGASVGSARSGRAVEAGEIGRRAGATRRCRRARGAARAAGPAGCKQAARRAGPRACIHSAGVLSARTHGARAGSCSARQHGATAGAAPPPRSMRAGRLYTSALPVLRLIPRAVGRAGEAVAAAVGRRPCHAKVRPRARFCGLPKMCSLLPAPPTYSYSRPRPGRRRVSHTARVCTPPENHAAGRSEPRLY